MIDEPTDARHFQVDENIFTGSWIVLDRHSYFHTAVGAASCLADPER